MENTKVRYSVDGSYYDIPSDKVEDFERDTPQARQVYRVGEDTYAIPLDKRDGFTAQYPDAEYWNGGRVNAATEPVQQPTLSDQGQQATVTPQPQQEQKQGFWARLGKNLSQAESSPQGMSAPEQTAQPQAEQKTDLPENWEERSAEFDTDYDNFSKVINAKLAEKTDVYKQRSMERESRMGKFLSGIVNAGQAEGGAITPQAREEIAAGGDEEADQLRAASQLFDSAKKTKDAAYKQKGLLSGLADSAEASTWDFGITDMKTAQQVYKLAQKIENNEELAENDNLLMEAMLQNAFANEYYSGQLKRGYKAGQVTGESLPFMLEFLMNPLAGGEKAASGGAIKVLEKSLAKKMAERAERAAVKSAEKTALKTALEKGGELAMKGLARGTDDLLSAAGMAATTGSIRTLEDTYSRKTGNVQFREDPDGGLVFDGFAGGENNWWKAAAKAYGATTIEDFSEMLGNYFRPIGQTAKKGMYFINKWAGLEKVNNFIDGIGAKDWARATSEFLKRTEWNGPISEFNEELVGGVMNAIFIGDQTLDGSDPNGVFNRDNLIDTFLGVAVFGGVVSAMKTAGYSREAQQNSKMRSEAVIAGEQSFGDDWSRIQKQIDGADEQAMKQILLTAFEPGSEYTPEQKQAILKYAGVRMVQIGLEKGRQKKEEYINEGINEGKTLTAPQEINQQDIDGEYNREKAARETASEGEPTAASELGVEHADAVQQGRREAMQSNIEEGVGQQFWKSEDIVRPAEDGQSAETVQEDVVDVITYPDGHEEYVVSESDGTLATVDATGKRGFATEAQIQENQGVRSSVPLNTYLDTKVGEQSTQAEQQRMAQDAANNLAALQQRVQEEGQINVGTPENEQMATVIDMLRDPAVGGVVVQVEGEQQPRTLSWREVATAYGMPLEPKSNAQIVNERINAEEEVEKYNNGITQDAELVVPMEGENAIYQFRYAEDIDGDVIIRAYDPAGGQEVDLTPEMVENLDALLNGNTPTAPVADVQGNPVPEVEVQPEPTDIFNDPAANALGISSDYAYTTKRGTVVVDGSKLWAENPTLWAEWNDRNENRVIPTKEYLEGKLQEIDKEVETARANLEEEARGSQNPDRMDDLQDILDKKTARQREVRGLVSKYEAAEATAAEMQQAAEAQQEAQEAAPQSIVGEEQAAPATAEEILASTQAALDTVDQQMAQVRSAEDYRLAMEAKAEALQQMFDALGAENTVVSTRADIVEVFRAAGGSEANARALAENLRLTAGKERMRGFYNNGKIFIIADDIRGAEDANVTQLHEAKHLENAATGAVNEGLRTGVTEDEMRAAVFKRTGSHFYDDKSRRELVDEVLANAEEIAEREGVEAIPQRLAEAGIVNGEFINFVQNNINNGRRGSQRRHLGGRHALQSVDSEISGREDVRDTQPQPAAVEGQGLRPDAGGEQGAGGTAEQPAEPAGEPGLAEEPAPQSAEEAETTREITANIGGRIEEEGGEAPTLFSITAGAEGVGLNATEANESGNVVFMSKDGRIFDGHNPITAEDLKNEPNTVMGFMMADALKYGTITPEQADTIWQKYADILNRMLEKGLAENGGFDNLSSQWQWVGETVFKTIHDNSDAQYKHSIDITRVCKKNEAVIKAISALQRRLGYGITPGQIMDIYNSSIEEGYQVPCPVCYVFSRYIGNGYIATVAINGQKKYGSRLVDPSTMTDREKKEAIKYWVKELQKVEAKNEKHKDKISQAKKDIQTILNEIDGLSRKALDKATPKEEKAQALRQIKALDKRYKAALNVVSQSNLAKWIKNFAIKEVKGGWTLYDDTFQGFPAEYALDLRLTADAIRKYPGIQRMRKSLGSAGGKVIQFAANNDIGDVPMLLGHSESEKAKNYYKLAAEAKTDAERDALLQKATDQFGKALIYAQQQSLRGGQRMWSWSDNIERLAPDVFFNLMQMEMLGGALQSYSKQLEGINMVANMGGYVNGSLMGKGIGYQDVAEDQVELIDGREVLKEDITETVTEYDGDGAKERTRILAQAGSPIFSDNGRRVVLVFDDIVGVDPYGKNGKKGLFALNATLDKAGNILVGMDDTHIRAAMADDRVFFIIPWHKSGLSSHILAQMMEYLGVDTSEFDPKDYTNVQEEKDPADGNVTPELVSFWEAHKNETDFQVGFGRSIPSGRDGKLSQEQIDYRNLRDAIFDGRVDENPKFLKAVMRDAFLSQVYEKAKERVAAGKMTAGDKKYVYPYEYWDESSTYATADVNGARYLEYCRRLGIKPKFVGKLDANAKEDFGNFADDKGYWKLLIDRRMYDVNGNFQDLTPVTTDNFTPDLVDPEMTEQEFEVTKVADDAGVERIADRTMALEENRPGGMATVDYDMDLDRAVRDYDRLSLSVVGGEENQLTDAQRFAYEFVNGTPAEESQTEETDIRPSMVGMDILEQEGVVVDNEAMLDEYGLSHLTLTKNGDVVTVNRVEAAEQGQGAGTRFMNELAAEADKNGWTLALTPDDTFGATSVSRLKKFYKRFGFKENKGRNTDFTINESMVRVPDGIRYSIEQEEAEKTNALFDAAKERFGTTRDIREAGYVLPDGTMLDFSGRHWLAPGSDSSYLAGDRQVDHRDIADLEYERDGNTPTGIETSMSDFIRRGAIRINDGSGASINLAVKPTPEQASVLTRLIEHNNGDVYLDLGDGERTDASTFYEGAKARRVINDIKRYFDEGIAPEGGINFSIRGILGAAEDETAMANLDTAKQMEADGKDAKTIWLATGWEKGADGKWRNEIPDATPKPFGLSKRSLKVEDIVDAPELFASYPEMKDYKVSLKKMSSAGSFNPNEKEIEMDRDYNTTIAIRDEDQEAAKEYFRQRWAEDPTHPADIRKDTEKKYGVRVLDATGLRTVMHELQHAIQDIEGFARGGNSKTQSQDYLSAAYKRMPEVVTFARAFSSRNAAGRLLRVGRAKMIDYIDRNINAFGRADEREMMSELRDYLAGTDDYGYRRLVNDAAGLWKVAKEQGNERYNRLAGEVEARNVETRMGLTEEQRRETPISATEDVAREEQGVRFSVSADIAAKYPNWMDNQTTTEVEGSKRGQNTQVAGTVGTYKKVGGWIDKNIGKDAQILDASSGLGLGTLELRKEGFQVDDIEPYPGRGREEQPTYGGVDAYQQAMDDGKEYDYIISNAVLNVIPDDWRDGVLHDMATLLKPGGLMFINTRKAGEEKTIKNKIELESPQEVLVGTPEKITSYQRFFTPSELKEYVEKELGDGYTVEIANEKNSGTKGLAAVVVTKNASEGAEAEGWFGKGTILEKYYPKNEAETVDEGFEYVKRLFNKPLTNKAHGFSAVITKNKSEKLKSGKSIKKSVNPRLHAMALANIDSLFENAEIDYTHPDTKGKRQIEKVHRLGTLMWDKVTGEFVPVKITVFEYNTNGANKVYTIEAVDIEKEKSAGQLEGGSESSDRSPIADFTTNIDNLLQKANNDAEYLKAVDAGDMEKAQRMVRDAFKSAFPDTKVVDEKGTPMVMYHGTPDMSFTKFAKPGESFQGLIWMTDQKRYAEIYAEEYDGEGYPNEGAGVYELFANISNPLDLGYIEDVVGSEGWNKIASDLGMAPDELFNRLNPVKNYKYTYEDAKKRMAYIYDFTRGAEFVSLLKEKGFDGVFALEEGINKTPTYGAVNPNQVKSAAPVTYDGNGNVIPLSERFNPDNDDIRFSVQSEPESLFDRYNKQDGEQYPWMSEDELIDRIEEEIPYGVASRPLYAKIDEYRRLDEEDFDEGRRDFSGGEKDEVFQEILSELQKYEKGADQQSLRFSIANENQSIFVSNAENAVRMIQMGKATPEQWQKMIEKNGGLKAGEDKWLGLSDWLKASDRKSITKQEVLDFIDQNKIRIEETRYAQEVEEYDMTALKSYDDEFNSIIREMTDAQKESAVQREPALIANDAFIEMIERYGDDFDSAFTYNDNQDGSFSLEPEMDIYDDRPTDAAKYYLDQRSGAVENRINRTRLSYTTEGLDNKREIALTVPTIESWNENDEIHFGDAGQGRAIAWVRFGDDTIDEGNDSQEADMSEQLREYEQRRDDLLNEFAGKYGFELSTFDPTRIMPMLSPEDAKRLLDVVRTKPIPQERVFGPKKKVLFIDEIQSKRHQEGREQGYRDEAKIAELEQKRRDAQKEYEDYIKQLLEKYKGARIPADEHRSEELNEEVIKANNALIKAMGGIPAAPFEKNWHELAMKRMLRLAAEEGYDYVAWTKGEQQAERYSLSKVITGVQTARFLNEPDVRYVYLIQDGAPDIELHVNEEGVVTSVGSRYFSEYEGEKLSDIIGKELAVKTMATETDKNGNAKVVAEGEDLRIGGEGMRGFYDDILPRFVNKYAKKWGVKVEDINLPNLESNGITAHAIPVTQEMKESVMEGQLMFSVQAVEEQEDRQRLIGAVDNGGLEAVLGDEGTQEFYRDAYISIPESELRKIVEQGLAEGGNIYAQLRAYMHKLAQDGTENDPTGLLFKLFDDVRFMTANAALTDSDIRYIIWKGTSVTDPGDILAIAEARAMRKRWGVGEMPMEQQFQEATEIAAENTEERLDAAKRNLKEEKKKTYGPLEAINRAMAAQKTYDKETVDSIVKFAKEIMKNGGVSALTLREANRLLSLINNSTGKSPKFVTRYADQLMDMLLEHIVKEEAAKFDKLVKVKANKVSSSGVEVQGKLDIIGQAVIKAFRENMNSPVEDIRTRMEDATERMDDKDDAIREEAMAAYSGLMLALQYKEKIADNEEEYKDLKNEFNEVSAKLPQLIGRKAYDEFIASSKEALRKNLMERVDMYRELSRKLTEMIGSSAERAAEFRKAEQARVNDIHHDANRDMQGVSTREHRRDTAWQRFLNSDFVRFFLKSLATGDQMFRMLGRKSVDGQGFLFNRYIKNGFIPASERAARGMFDAYETLDAKVSEVFDEPGMKWSDLYRIERKLPGMTVSFLDGGEMIDHELTQGNMLYIYMANKMNDGKMKLRKMGISEEDVQAIKKNLDPRFVELADWMQDEFYVNLRNKYNEVHERMFGAPMAAIEDYVPLKILSNARFEDVDLGSDQSQAELSSTITGSIIKRRRNSLAIDILHTDAFSLAIEHVEKMEDWAAFAELRRDINTLLSYKHFRNQVQNMNTVYGSGKTLWNNFKDVCKVTIGKYQPKVKAGDIDTMALNVAKGVTAAKIAFRVNTAIKQLLSFPAYLSDARIDYLMKSLATPGKSWKWCMENLPLFEKRWKSRIAGDTRLLDTDSDWKIWRDNVVKTASRLGMTPNAFVDATTVAIGAKAMYDTKKAQYLKDGYSEEKADDMAKKDAEILYNQTQQSSETAFVSPVQLDRTVMAVTLTTYRNSSMAYQRQLHDAIRTTARMMKPGYRDRSIAFMKNQNMNNGLSEEEAQRAAERQYNRQWLRNLARVAVFGYGLQFLWKIGNDMWYLLFGDDDDEKQKILEEAALAELAAPLEGLVAGNVISDLWSKKAEKKINENYGIKTSSFNQGGGLAKLPIESDTENILNRLENDKPRALNDIIDLVVQAGVGVNPQTLSDAVVALIDYTNGDVFNARDLAFFLMRVAQLPQSTIEKFLIDEIDFDANPEERDAQIDALAKRYAMYKLLKNTTFANNMYDEDKRDKKLGNYENNFKKAVKERMAIKETVTGKETPKTPEETYKDIENEMKAFQTRLNIAVKANDTVTEEAIKAEPDYQRYLIWKRHQKGINKLNKQIKNTQDEALREQWEQQLRDSIQLEINELSELK